MLPVPKGVLKLLFSGQLKWEEGKINLLDVYTFIAPVEFFEYYTKFIRKDKKLIDDFYLAGWVAGYTITKKLMNSYELKTPQERYTLTMNFLEVGGYGTYKTIEFIPGVRSHFFYISNPLPAKFYPSKEPVCDYMRGLGAGGGTQVHKKIVNGIELDCAAINGKYCDFINFCFDDKITIKKYSKIIKAQFHNYEKIINFERKYIKEIKDTKEIFIKNSKDK